MSLRRWNVLQLLLLCGVCAAVWAAVAAGCLCFGSTEFGWPHGFVMSVRRESVLNASLIGAALAASGVAYQAILQNPLADPYLLGVSSGATLAVYVWELMAIAPPALAWLMGFTEQGVAFVGALAALGVVFLLAQRGGRLEPVVLLMVGVIVNAICVSVCLLLQSLNLRNDPTGGLGGGSLRLMVGGINPNLSLEQRQIAAAIVGAAWIVLFYISGQLNVAPLDDAEAQALGVRIHRLRWVGLMSASVAAAAAVAISGPIGFVALVCPHLARLLVGVDHRRLMPVATMLGAVLLCAADTACRQLSPQTWGALPVGVLTGLLGGPFFLFLLWRSRAAQRRRSMGT